MTRLQGNLREGRGCNTSRNRGRVGGSSSRTTRLQVNLTGGGARIAVTQAGYTEF